MGGASGWAIDRNATCIRDTWPTVAVDVGGMRTTMRATMLFVLLPVFWMCHGVRAQEGGSDLPNPQLTPGDSVNVSAADICKPNYKNRRSKVSAALKSQVFARYRLNGYDLGYNVELLIPASLGGSNSITNLWPQRLSAEWSWQRKNRLEHRLRKLV